MPNMIIIAGPNGAGKSTTAPGLLKDALNVDDFVNADTIAEGLSAFSPQNEAIAAGRIMLKRIHELANSGANFAFETTLASRSFATWIPKLKADGYQIHLIFLWLENVELAISRVKERIKLGGHAVPIETIKRRYFSGIKNFFNLYQPLLDQWQFCDNTILEEPIVIATGSPEKTNIYDKHLWQHLQETYHGKEIQFK